VTFWGKNALRDCLRDALKALDDHYAKRVEP
jgi:hypothetical protein